MLIWYCWLAKCIVYRIIIRQSFEVSYRFVSFRFEMVLCLLIYWYQNLTIDHQIEANHCLHSIVSIEFGRFSLPNRTNRHDLCDTTNNKSLVKFGFNLFWIVCHSFAFAFGCRIFHDRTQIFVFFFSCLFSSFSFVSFLWFDWYGVFTLNCIVLYCSYHSIWFILPSYEFIWRFLKM